MRIAVTGARGQLGAAVVDEWSARRSEHEVVPLGRGELDIADDRAVRAVMERLQPDVIINCAAYNDVDGAEDHPVAALDANAFAVRALALTARAVGAALVHYSSDFVFDGTSSMPYTEDDRPNPRSVYACSKLLGEWFAADVERWYVLRVESLFGRVPGGPLPKGTVAGIMNKLMAGSEAKVLCDRTVSATYVIDAARATRELLERSAPAGLYHCVNSGHSSWLEFAHVLADELGVEAHLTPMRMADMPLRAQRPQYCALSNEKLKRAGVAMPPWQDALRRFVDKVKTKN
jgi:dTDP-4-dehydrorhamnose reductase